jgi:3-dehydroquinate synthase
MSQIFYKEEVFLQLNIFLQKKEVNHVFVLVDENTAQHCLPILASKIDIALKPIKIKSGEIEKNLETVVKIWEKLLDYKADRSSVLINLGGGVITDIGGFVALTYKRGIDYINLPTTLLGMVDAAIGGKTGVDFKHLKNQIGIIAPAVFTGVFPDFLKTLPEREIRSGFAEILKYGLIADPKLWNDLMDISMLDIPFEIIQKSAQIKQGIVVQDPTEKGLRKVLNFGHTLGHAIETHFMSKPKEQRLLHGEAIAAGMIMASYLSHIKLGLGLGGLGMIKDTMTNLYPKVTLTDKDIKAIKMLLIHDKKNKNGKTLFVLLEAIGKPVWGQTVSHDEIDEAIAFYLN